jgi:DNA polymerase-3 subunit epsilon
MITLYLDFETTGLDTGLDRIIEAGLIIETQDGQRDTFQSLVNPKCPIPAESTQIHGIKDEDVADAPVFADIFPDIQSMVEKCDAIAGYNVNFDLKILMAESRRLSKPLPLHNKTILDMQKIFFHHEPRNLTAALKFYCKKELEGGHRAINDVEATIDVFKAQIERYELNLEAPEVKAYAELQLPLDSNGAFSLNAKDQVIINFGKFKGKVANGQAQDMRNYLGWMINANFPPDTKSIARALLKGVEIRKDNLEQVILGASS